MRLSRPTTWLAAISGRSPSPEPPLTLVNVEQPRRPQIFTADTAIDLAEHIDDRAVRKGEYRLFDARGRRSGVYIWNGRARWARWWSPPVYLNDLKRARELAHIVGSIVEMSAADEAEIPVPPIVLICSEPADPFFELTWRTDGLGSMVEDGRDIESGEFQLFDSGGKIRRIQPSIATW
jgi:hypothetical protein